MQGRKEILTLILVMALVAITIGAAAIAILYDTAYRQQEQRIAEITRGRARLVTALAEQNRDHIGDQGEGWRAATLREIAALRDWGVGFAQSGEFSVARQVAGRPEFLVQSRRDGDGPLEIKVAGPGADGPMQRALAGQSGTMTGQDYRGVDTLAAYAPVPLLGLGIVVRIDVGEMRAPFIRTGLVVLALALAVMALGTFVFMRVVERLARELEASEKRYRGLVDGAPDAVFVHDGETILYANNAAAEMLGAGTPAELVGRAALTIANPDEREETLVRIQQILAHGGALPLRRMALEGVDGRRVEAEVTGRAIEWDDGAAIEVVARPMAELKNAEAGVMRLNAELGIILDSAHIGIVFAKNRRIVRVNRHFEELSGWTNAECVGRGTEFLFADRGDYEEAERRIMGGAAPGGLFESEMFLRRKDDSRVLIRFVGQPVDPERPEDGIIGLYEDITERKEWEQALRDSEERYRGLVESSPDAVYVRQDDKFVFLNNTALELFGVLTSGQILGNPVMDHIAPQSRRSVAAHSERVLAEGARDTAQEVVFLRRDGSTIDTEVAASRVNWKGAPAIQVVVRDTTERKRIHRELLEAKEQAELASRFKTNFLANMSHELRTPLNSIIGFCDIMVNEMFGPLENEKYSRYLHLISDSGELLLALINDLLDVSKIESGALGLDESKMDISELFVSCRQLVLDQAENAGVTLNFEPVSGLPSLRADPLRMKQVLINLISNAIKFTPAGGTVTVDGEIDATGGLALSISDTGIGIPENELESVFEPFHQVDSGMSRENQGTGLGLPLSRSLVELHGGTLELESRVGTGTSVIVRLPRNRCGPSPRAGA